jgi:starch synthase
MKIAIVAAEAAPYAKAGGLADVIGALPGALAAAGAEVSVVIPGYKSALRILSGAYVVERMSLEIGDREERFTVRGAPGVRGVQYYLVEHPGYFGRDGIYGENGRDYPDNLRRYVFFGRAAAALIAARIKPDLVHAHDWHASVVPVVMGADPATRANFARTLKIFTIHNLAFQGICDPGDFLLLNLDWSYFSIDCLEFHGRINLMKGAVTLADGVSTVSPTYAREVTESPELGFGLDGVLRAKGERFIGILNGADYNEWDPERDEIIATRYGPSSSERKRVCTGDLRKRVGLTELEGVPVVGMITRMTPQKGLDLLREALDAVMEMELQLVILGSGDPELEDYFRRAEERHPGRLRMVTGFDNALAHRIQAGADIFLMPSRFEPCGLTQMYALKYGTVPVVRATGGLRDTITEFDPDSGLGNGFVFSDYRSEDLVAALAQAVALYKNREAWGRLMQNAFGADFSWDRAASEYLDWFNRLRADRGLIPEVTRLV